ncbi:MAG: excinuclease ABC subunit A, partial [Bdellovibrionota bacterium]
RQNNLKNITVTIPHRKITVVTGLSGSGKSSLAFDTLYAEGQRRYVESLSTYTRQFLDKMPKPEVEHVENIPPSIALEQKNGVLNSRSSVGTQTEILDYMRVLFARIGRTRCVDCGGPVEKLDAARFLAWALDRLPGRRALILAPAPLPSAPEAPTKKKSRSAAKPKLELDIPQWLKSFREQGFRRVYWENSENPVLDLDDLEQPDFPKIPVSAVRSGKIFIVIDRLTGAEARSRLADSIDQALAIGRGKVVFSDPDCWKAFERGHACVECGRAHRLPDPNLFSFNSPIGACARCSGFGHTLELDEALVVPDPSKTLKNGAIDPLSKPSMSDSQKELFRFCERNGISVGKRYRELTPAQRKLIWDGDEKFGIRACFEGLKKWKYKLHVRVFIRRYQTQSLCPDCLGARLQPEALAVHIGGRSIAEAQKIAITDLYHWFQALELSPSERKIAGEALFQVDKRLHFLDEVGVGYLTLGRLTRTLS